jgi:hypothetical protein
MHVGIALDVQLLRVDGPMAPATQAHQVGRVVRPALTAIHDVVNLHAVPLTAPAATVPVPIPHDGRVRRQDGVCGPLPGAALLLGGAFGGLRQRHVGGH